jgi:hypothetical protein
MPHQNGDIFAEDITEKGLKAVPEIMRFLLE